MIIPRSCHAIGETWGSVCIVEKTLWGRKEHRIKFKTFKWSIDVVVGSAISVSQVSLGRQPLDFDWIERSDGDSRKVEIHARCPAGQPLVSVVDADSGRSLDPVYVFPAKGLQDEHPGDHVAGLGSYGNCHLGQVRSPFHLDEGKYWIRGGRSTWKIVTVGTEDARVELGREARLRISVAGLPEGSSCRVDLYQRADPPGRRYLGHRFSIYPQDSKNGEVSFVRGIDGIVPGVYRLKFTMFRHEMTPGARSMGREVEFYMGDNATHVDFGQLVAEWDRGTAENSGS